MILNCRKIYESFHLGHKTYLYDEVCQLAPNCKDKEDVERCLEKLKNNPKAEKFFPLMYTALNKCDEGVIDTIKEMFDWVIHDRDFCSHY